jgi:hypothetical protein
LSSIEAWGGCAPLPGVSVAAYRLRLGRLGAVGARVLAHSTAITSRELVPGCQ